MAFTEWYKEVCDQLIKSKELKLLESEFVKKSDDSGRIDVLLSSNVLFQTTIAESFNSKNNKQSDLYRTTGNKFYAGSSFDLALKSYTRAIKLAEKDSRSLSLGYANRSAVLFASKKFNLCKDDIAISLETGYPEELHYKVFERLGKCYVELSLFEKASESFDKCLESLNSAKISSEQIEDKKTYLHEIIKKCSDKKDNPMCRDIAFNCLYQPSLPLITRPNSIYLSASKSFAMKSDKTHGRYAVASEDIKAGEIILVEKPFASLCLPDCFETHCYLCLTRFIIGHPCRNCSTILYCSTDCEKKSWTDSHQYECNFLNVLTQDDIGLGHLALRVVLKNSFVQLKKFYKRFDSNEFGLNEKGLYSSDDYFCLYSLVGNSNLRKLSDLFKRSVMAVFLAKILLSSGFVSDECEELTLTIVASNLLKQIQMLPCNAHEISEAELASVDIASNELKEIGSAAYTSLSLLNHSCDPSVVRHCYRDVCVVRALKHIKKGEEIIDNYGFLYAVEEKLDRIKHLADQYYFTCQCVPCKQNWPLYNKLPDEPPSFLCKHCLKPLTTKSFKCNECSTEDLEVAEYYQNDWQSKYQTAMECVLKEKDINKNREFLLRYLDLVTRRAQLPTIHVNNCQEFVKLCFSLSANFARL